MNETTQKGPLGPRLSVHRDAVFALLKQLAFDNEVFFRRNGTSNHGLRLADCCQEISSSVFVLKDLVKQLQEASHKCDYDENTPGNGFRSLICVCDMIILHLVSVLRICSESRNTLMFRASHYCKEVEGFTAVIRFLVLSFQQLVAGLPMLEEGSLFPPLNSQYEQYNGILKSIESLDTTCFYARPLGFQFCPSVTRIFRFIGFVLATYSLTWEKDQRPWHALVNSGRFLLSSEQRASRIDKVIREADIDFCRGFWNLAELPGNVPRLYSTFLPMAISEMRNIPLCGPLPLQTNTGEFVLIPEPSAHTGPRSVSMRVLSSSHREGLSNESALNKLPKSPYLVIHCHGGGYVATSSKSHETYLRAWAKSLNCPLVSIDYSLSPENPFPRPTEEVLYAYAWILNNPEKLGWTGDKVCMVGDSAGGNLTFSTCLRLIELNAKRLPDGLVPMYTPFLFQYLPSPSRVLSFMDPLLHMGVVIRCAAAYTSSEPNGKTSQPKTPTTNGTSSAANGHKSLLEYVDEVQKAQKHSILDFSKGSQAIVSLVNLSQTRTSFLYQMNVSSSDSGNSSEGSVKRVKSEVNTTLETEELLDEDEVLDDELNTTQTVHVDGDPDHICLSSTHYDANLIDYLQLHPLTKRSLQVNDADAHQIDSEPEPEDDFVFDETTPKEFIGKKSTLPQDFKTPLPKSATTSQVNFSCTTPTDCNAEMPDSDEEESQRQPSSAKFLQRSSQCQANIFSSAGRKAAIPKRPLSRNTRSLSQSLADTAVLATGHAFDTFSNWFETPSTPIGSADKRKLTRAVTLTPQVAAKIEQEEAENHESAFTELLKLTLPRDHLISPMYTPDEILRKLPPVWFIGCHLDPLLDDTIMFAKKLRDAGGQVKGLDLLDSLPHGFLNFTMVSAECKNGANICLKRIKEALHFEDSA